MDQLIRHVVDPYIRYMECSRYVVCAMKIYSTVHPELEGDGTVSVDYDGLRRLDGRLERVVLTDAADHLRTSWTD